MFGPAFSQFNLGARRGLMTPAPIIPMTSAPFKLVTRELTNAELLGLNATPIELIPGVPGKVWIPIGYACRAIKPGAAAWTTSPTLSIIHEGNNTALVAGTLTIGLNTAAAIDLLVMNSGVNTSSFSFLTFNRVGLALQLRATNVPNQGAGSNATAFVTIMAGAAAID